MNQDLNTTRARKDLESLHRKASQIRDPRHNNARHPVRKLRRCRSKNTRLKRVLESRMGNALKIGFLHSRHGLPTLFFANIFLHMRNHFGHTPTALGQPLPQLLQHLARAQSPGRIRHLTRTETLERRRIHLEQCVGPKRFNHDAGRRTMLRMIGSKQNGWGCRTNGQQCSIRV